MKLTQEYIDSVVVDEQYYRFGGTTHTVCCIKLECGFTVIGESACISPEDFDAAVGRNLASEDARRKIWELEGYAEKKRRYLVSRQVEAI